MLTKFNLQLLADAAGSDNPGAEAGQNEGTAKPESQEGKEAKSEKLSFDDFLADPKNQSIFDKRLNKAIETAKTKWEAEANLSAEEKAQKRLKEKELELEEKEKAFNQKMFTLEIKDKLQEADLPTMLAPIIAKGATSEMVDEIIGELEEDYKSRLKENALAGARQETPGASTTKGGAEKFNPVSFARENRIITK